MNIDTLTRIVRLGDQEEADSLITPGWWKNYLGVLRASGLTDSSLSVIDEDSAYIVNQGIFGAGEPSAFSQTWNQTGVRKGLVIGSVQSGKTASMLAVVSKALDRGVDMVIILAGTRTALWRQTFERTLKQLDGWTIANDTERRLCRVFLPSPRTLGASSKLPELNDMYYEHPNLIRRQLAQSKPLIAVVMKQTDHLMVFGKLLRKVIADSATKMGRPIHALIIDDEADDGSILDADIEAGLQPDCARLKQIPRHIERLWAGYDREPFVLGRDFFATYMAYTATPQANILQSDHNPLSPTDFVIALRTPLDRGSVAPPRSTTFEEPVGIHAYYTGGELFYRHLGTGVGALCDTREFPRRENFDCDINFQLAVRSTNISIIGEALRSYFVAGAIRLMLSKRSLIDARSAPPSPLNFIRSITPTPHSMLFHPSARIENHFAAARLIADWSRLVDLQGDQDPLPQDLNVNLSLDVPGLVDRLESEEPLWKSWVSSFEDTRNRLTLFPGGEAYNAVGEEHWSVIREILIKEIFPHTRLAIVNSDPRADDRPRFDCVEVENSLYLPPPDIYSIFVSGNVMSRGITLEGLTTTLFLRSAEDPAADTQMQMQRWFGYRGKLLCWCRVFLFSDQFALFRDYYECDEALRREVINETNNLDGLPPSPLVLQGENFRATGKIANLRALPLCPGADPFVRILETGQYARTNANVLAKLLNEETWSKVEVGGIVRGKCMNRRLSLLEVATLLESLCYETHFPNPKLPQNDRWKSIAAESGLRDDESLLFRIPKQIQATQFSQIVAPPYCPYTIAAYLRLWRALLTRAAPGFFPTDDRQTPWSMINLVDYGRTAPEFYVGVRYGSAGLSNHEVLANHGVLRMERSSRNGVLTSTWGSRNPGGGDDVYYGDQLFDYHVHQSKLPERIVGEPVWRPRGSPGLLLFHVIRMSPGDIEDATTVGLALPLGGPDHFAALRSPGR